MTTAHPKYNAIARLYDVLDYPWEWLYYRHWRKELIADVHGKVLEAGVGTGRNLEYYSPDVQLTGFDQSPLMLTRAAIKAKKARCKIELLQSDATTMVGIPSQTYDWLISTFMCCVIPDQLHPLVVEQFQRVLKPQGRFRLLDMVYSKNRWVRLRQKAITPWLEAVFSARFDRPTLACLEAAPLLKITNTRYLKDDVYLLIEGVRL